MLSHARAMDPTSLRELKGGLGSDDPHPPPPWRLQIRGRADPGCGVARLQLVLTSICAYFADSAVTNQKECAPVYSGNTCFACSDDVCVASSRTARVLFP